MCAQDLVRPSVGTERLVLRGPAAGDAGVIADMANDFGVAGMTTCMPFPYALSDAEGFLWGAARVEPRKRVEFVVEHRQFGVIGCLGLHERAERRPELGYWLGRSFWGRGYATEAVKAALVWASAEWDRHAVWAGHFADNRASGQVLVKAGFLYTGDVAMRPSAARGGEAVATRMMVWLA